MSMFHNQFVHWDLPTLVAALQPIINHECEELRFDGVPEHVLQSVVNFSSTPGGHAILDGFEALRIDFNRERLIVHWPTRWDAIPKTIFARLIHQGLFQPNRMHNGHTLFDVGDIDIAQTVRLLDGIKCPVFRIHPRQGLGGSNITNDPTFVIEVGFSSQRQQLHRNAARYICMSGGEINIASSLELDFFEFPDGSLVLMKAVWSNWRLQSEELVPGMDGRQPPVFRSIPYSANANGSSQYEGIIDATRYVAYEDERYQIFPHESEGPQEITFLYDDFLEFPENDNAVAARIPFRLIEEVIFQHSARGPQGWIYDPESEDYPVGYLGTD
ncbi:hypothetical protein NLI96_g1483 [Meripilus lineatus]|uniref:Uncharacterized protein n=1 Tax=Meripilus lineatus TaxID=2056292 RepID=A0AAD5VA14_9APHY|nr:hypothetical protein NLI96_g1483 [Physisporinus lineatus]